MAKHFLQRAILAVGLATLLLPVTVSAIATGARDTLGDGTYVNKNLDYYMNDVRGNTGLGGYDDVANEGPILTASRVINFLLMFLGTVAVGLTVYAGYLWLMSRGNDEDITKAKAILTGSVIGILLVLASYGIMSFVFRSLTNITN